MSVERLMTKRDVPFSLFDVNILDATDEELQEISSTMGLALSVDEMRTIVDYFKKEGRNPTDVELQSVHILHRPSGHPFERRCRSDGLR